MTPLEISLVSAIIPLLIALTAWLRAELANSAAKAANLKATGAVASARQASAVASTAFSAVMPKPTTPPDGDAK